MNIGLFSYLSAFVGYLTLTILLIVSWRRNPTGVSNAIRIKIVVASVSTTVWAGLSGFSTLSALPLQEAIPTAELTRNAAWCLFMLNIFEVQKQDDEAARRPMIWTKSFLFILIIAIVILLVAPTGFDKEGLSGFSHLNYMVWVSLALIGLLVVEQVFRNTSPEQKWFIKYLCLGIGLIFAYDFYLYSDALLFNQVSLPLWDARGLINAVAVPLIAVSIARNPTWDLGIHVSRNVVFHSATLLGAGVYLLIMAGAGYYVRYYAGTWGGVLQVAFFIAAGMLLVVLLFSDQIRTQARVLISKHFFSYKYDYREEWQNFTKTIASGDGDVPQQVSRALSTLVNSNGSLLWAKHDSNQLELMADRNMPVPELTDPQWGSELLAFVEATGWIIDLDEYRLAPESYPGLTLPRQLAELEQAWLIVPLILQSRPLGIVIIKRTEVQQEINWEDRDLLKMAGQQAATYLAQYLTDKALIEARQFEAFNRLSAYVIHDLKNILAQQALIVTNAEKHKNKPEFIEDVFKTIENSVERMTRLMEQMKRGARGNESTSLELSRLLTNAVARRCAYQPVPELEMGEDEIFAHADKDQLATVFAHIIQNAQEATDDSGQITIRLASAENQATVEIEDTGSGMNSDFIENRLFKAFESTKGLTGMGIGLFESREYLRSLGGNIFVSSTLGNGSLFRIHLPCQSTATTKSEQHAMQK